MEALAEQCLQAQFTVGSYLGSPWGQTVGVMPMGC